VLAGTFALQRSGRASLTSRRREQRLTDAAFHEFFLTAADVAGALIGLLRIGKAQVKARIISERHKIPEKIHVGQFR
jgi:hypothetical protein